MRTNAGPETPPRVMGQKEKTPMKKFKVFVLKSYPQSILLTVKAKNKLQAEKIALAQAKDGKGDIIGDAVETRYEVSCLLEVKEEETGNCCQPQGNKS